MSLGMKSIVRELAMFNGGQEQQMFDRRCVQSEFRSGCQSRDLNYLYKLFI